MRKILFLFFALCIPAVLTTAEGGGGTGDSCNIPDPMECQSYQQCVCQRPSGIYDYGQCIDGACQF